MPAHISERRHPAGTAAMSMLLMPACGRRAGWKPALPNGYFSSMIHTPLQFSGGGLSV